MTTPESHARIRRWFDRLIELPRAERERRLEAADLAPDERAELAALLTTGGSRPLTSLGAVDVAAALRDVELRPLFEDPPPGFELEEVLGRGGMGTVFLARQLEPPRPVALKVGSVRRGGAEAARTTDREAQVLARLRHPGVAHVIAAGTLDQGSGLVRPWYAMELVEDARDLVEYAEDSRLDRSGRVELMCDVCDAVQHGHEKGVLHGDLKPANVLVDAEGRVKVIDFGVARLLGEEDEASGPVGGTPRYMAPELRGGAGRADVRSDIYALGALLGELVDSRADREVGWVSTRAMAPAPRDRYPSAASLGEELRRLLERRPVAAGPAGFVYATSKFAQRNARSLVALSVTLVLAAVGGVNGLRVHAAEKEASEERQRATEEANRAFWLLRDATLAASAPFEQGRSPEARARTLLARLAHAGPAVDAPASHASDRQMLVGFGYHALGDLDAAALALERAARGYAALGVPEDPRLYLANTRLAEVELDRGVPAAAQDAAGAALAALPRERWPARERALPATLLARALIEQGDFAGAELVADEVLAAGTSGEPGRVGLALARVWARASGGIATDVRAEVEPLLAEAERVPSGRLADELARHRLAARALAASGDLAGARTILTEALERFSGQLTESHPKRIALERALAELDGAPAPLDDPAVEELRAGLEERLVAFNEMARGRDLSGLAAAVPELERVVAEARGTLGDEDPLTDQAVLFLARGLLADGRPEAGRELLAGLREAPQRHAGVGPFTSGIYERVWAVTLLELDRPAEALPIAEECVRKARLQFRDEHRFVRICQGILEEARERAGQ